MSGVAGAYSERVPVLHIVGVPSTKAQEGGFLLHHTLGDGQFNVFERASEGITKAQAILKKAEGACEEIDRVLRVALQTVSRKCTNSSRSHPRCSLRRVTQARPTYLTLPTDLVFAPVDKSRLETPVVPPTPKVDEKRKLPAGIKLQEDEIQKLSFVTSEIQRLWDQAEKPIIIVDACALRYGVTHLVRDFVTATNTTYFSTPMGKAGLDEDTSKGFGGVYVGAGSDPKVREAVESADLTILVGSIQSDFNTAEFSWSLKTEQLIEL